MKGFSLVLGFVLAILIVAYLIVRQVVPSAGPGAAPTVATSLDSIREIGELAVLRASIKEIVTSKVGEATWIKTPGKLAIICHFDIKYKYNLHKTRIIAGTRADGTRYCILHLPKHEFDVATKEIRFYDDQDGTWLGFTQKTLPDDRTKALEAGRLQAESQARAFLGEMEGEIQGSARTTLTQIARAFGFSDVTVEFEQ